MNVRTATATALVDAAIAGDRGALARLITRIERAGPEAEEISAEVGTADLAAHVVGVTGAPGAGKSSLVGRLLTVATAAARRPAVVAVDPSSPLTGGAILGDRVRMDDVPAGAYVRSMATRGRRGGLAAAVPAVVRLLARVGFDPVIVETTGVGQVEVDVVSAADTTVLVVAPGWGDAVQANKAGLLEVADVLVVNKADRPGARDVRRDLRLMLDLGHVSGLEERSGRRPEVVMATSTTGDGAQAVWEAVEAHRAHLVATGGLDARRRRRLRAEVAACVDDLLAAWAAEAFASAAGVAALEAAEAGGIPPAQAARGMIARMATQA